jgi:predicted PhzF superfamily epimerase YddE/YHI9
MKIIYQVDAFTDEPFKGNPAGVIMIDENTEPEWMQNIALEMNLSETAFIIPYEDFFKIRYFTPEREVPLCGHATLASAHIIYETGILGGHKVINFRAEGGDLTVSRESDWIKMNFPEYPLKKINPIKAFKDTIGFEPVEMYLSLYDWIIAVARKKMNKKQWYETLFENYGQKYDNECFTQGTIGECDFIEKR